VRHRKSFIADQRGAVAFETLIVYSFLIFFLLLPLADLAIAGFQFISAHQALRDMAQRTQYSPPADVTDAASITAWTNSLPPKVAGYTVTAQVYCGNPGTLAPCAADAPPPAAPSPKHYAFSTSFTLSPMSPMLKSVLCSTCPVNYSQPFQ
jgi:Flp pilus assembly protein TadG